MGTNGPSAIPSKLETFERVCHFARMLVTKALKQLFETAEPPELGPGPRADVQAEGKLNQELDRALRGSALAADNQQLIRALTLLWHDHLEPAHVIAQGIESADGAYVHGIMHRREPDFSNAAYWFRRVGKHPAFGALAERVAAVIEGQKESPLGNLLTGNTWDPFAFIQQCEQAKARRLPEGQLREVQRIEFEVLLDWLAGDE